jgi:RNA polymerase sigma-70 factor (ECF subfamily)
VETAAPDARRRYEAVAAIVYEPLQRYLLRRVDPATADDVLGDVLVVLWRRLDDIPPEATLAWSYGVARRCLANSLRAADRQRRLVERVAQHAASPPAGNPALDAALEALPDSDRELLRLWAWEQLPPREIAHALGISPNAASVRLHRATKKLKAQLDRGKDDIATGHLRERQGREAP